jgi:hypothetical protein
MINKLGIPAIQTGVGRAQIQTPERKGGEAHEEAQRCCPSLVSKRTPNEDSQTQHETMLVSELTRWAFSKKWYWLKRQEAAAIWEQRKSRTGKKNETRLQLQEQVKDTAERKRAMKPPERTLSNEHEQYMKLKRAGLEKLIEVEKERADRQSMLRGLWRVQVTPEKNTSCCGRKNGRSFNRKLQKEARMQKTTESEEKMMELIRRALHWQTTNDCARLSRI